MSNTVRITCKAHTTAPHTDLEPYQGTLKDLSTTNYAKLKSSIIREGFCAPIFAWHRKGKLYTLDGHQRVRTLTKMAEEGYTIPEVPVDYIEAKSVQEAKRKILALTSQYGEITGDGLYAFMHEAKLNLQDLDAFRFPEIDLGDFAAEYFEEEGGNTDDDEVPDAPDDADCYVKPGDVWTLGDHTVVCGDNAGQGGGQGHATVTDPPYGIGYEYASHNDTKEGNEAVVLRALEHAPRPWVWTPGKMNLARELARHPEAKVLCWHKGFAQAGNGLGGASTWEPVLVLGASGGALANDYLHYGTDREEGLRDGHPCPKPVALFAELIDSLTSGDVYEPFLGSGTTLIACEKLNRRCYGIEIEPKYVQVAIERWQNYTGRQAVLSERGGEKQNHGDLDAV